MGTLLADDPALTARDVDGSLLAHQPLPVVLGERSVPEGAAVVEIGPTQAEKVAQIAAATGFSSELRRDLANRPRALILRLRLGKEPESG